METVTTPTIIPPKLNIIIFAPIISSENGMLEIATNLPLS